MLFFVFCITSFPTITMIHCTIVYILYCQVVKKPYC